MESQDDFYSPCQRHGGGKQVSKLQKEKKIARDVSKKPGTSVKVKVADQALPRNTVLTVNPLLIEQLVKATVVVFSLENSSGTVCFGLMTPTIWAHGCY